MTVNQKHCDFGLVDKVPTVVAGPDFRTAKIVTCHISPVSVRPHGGKKCAAGRPDATNFDLIHKPFHPGLYLEFQLLD